MPPGDDPAAPEVAPVAVDALAPSTEAAAGAPTASDHGDAEPPPPRTRHRPGSAPRARRRRPARVAHPRGYPNPAASSLQPASAARPETLEPSAAPDTESELRDWIKENAALLSNASLLISLAAIALNLLPNAGFLDPYIKGLIFGAALLLLIELQHQWPDDLQLHVLPKNIRAAQHSWRMTGFALLMQVATLVFAVWAILSNPLILVPLTALGIVLAFRQWYFRRFSGVLAKSFGILALIAVLVITELFLLVIWEATSQGNLTFEVWVDERAQPEVIP